MVNLATVEKRPIISNGNMQVAGQVANNIAAQAAFTDYRQRKSPRTLKRHRHDLRVFARYLQAAGVEVQCDEFQKLPECWAGVTWGIVKGFVKWQLDQGYAIGSINVRLSTVKIYAGLAVQAGIIPEREGVLIASVSGYSQTEAVNIDEKRPITRVGDKKPDPVSITAAQAWQLKSNHDDTEAGARNRLIMCLLLDHGLRASEAVNLTKDSFELDDGGGLLRFYRPKTKAWAVHKLTHDTYAAAVEYAPLMPESGPILRGSVKGGRLTDRRLTRVTVSRVVQRLGVGAGFFRVDRVPVAGGYSRRKTRGTLSAHDCRHYCATDMARRGYSIRELMDWFGWTSPAMAIRYIESLEVAERDKG